MKEIILNIIILVHVLVLIFCIITPFTNSTYLLFLHSIIIPFIMFHWILNDNTCALTLFEKQLRSQINGSTINDSDCFTCKIIHPIYDFKNNHKQFSVFIYTTAILLWSVSVYKLYSKYNYGEIKGLTDLFIL